MSQELVQALAGLLLGGLSLYAFWLYNKSEDEINFGTWAILAYGDLLDSLSYFAMTEKLNLNLVPMSFAFGSIATFFYALAKGRFGKLRRIDILCLVIDMIITVMWWYFHEEGITVSISMGPLIRDFHPATFANLAYQTSALIAFVPMWWSQVSGREVEHPTAWLLWTIVFGGFFVVMSYGYSKWEELVYPIVNLFTHFMIGTTALSVIYKPHVGTSPLLR